MTPTSHAGPAPATNVIKFPYSASRRVFSRRPRRSKNGTPEERAERLPLSAAYRAEDAGPLPLAELRRQVGTQLTAHNERLRAQRLEAWRKACAATCYWRALLDFYTALGVAQHERLVEACRDFRGVDPTDQASAAQKFREAEAAQLLTPAPDIASVNWKRARFASKRGFTIDADLKEKVARSIESDISFLKAHPARQTGKGRRQ